MKVEQTKWTQAKGWQPDLPTSLGEAAQLVLVFGATSILKKQEPLQKIKQAYPGAYILGCSTAGEICGTQIFDDALVATVAQFERTQLKGHQIKLSEVEDSFEAGEKLAMSLTDNGLTHVLVISDGLKVNGSDLVNGLVKHLPAEVAVTGGLAGDGARFKQTLTFFDNVPEEGRIIALGFYGARLKVGYGSRGGWDPFGPERLITRAEGNVLYELDGQSALELYKKYLGEYAADLPASGLLFPLKLRAKENEMGLVRTILSVSEKEQSMTFAGNVPSGVYARFMKANPDRLVDGAIEAAQTCFKVTDSSSPDLAILISCVGRKLVMGQRIEEELEGVRDVLGDHTVLTGFYSYGEISPFRPLAKCELHNQTMTITTFLEE
ncbi:MAG: FIST C-terminal domain-containing protein [Anaerolineae bacterium]|nr:FIST C-terminal domain-containing protein [Anaerolineae bacterium]